MKLTHQIKSSICFCAEGKTGVPQNLLGQKREPIKLHPHMTQSLEIKPGHIAGRRVLSPLRQLCFPNRFHHR